MSLTITPEDIRNLDALRRDEWLRSGGVGMREAEEWTSKEEWWGPLSEHYLSGALLLIGALARKGMTP